MKAVTLCSGSKGNSTYLEINKKNILIDCGISLKYLKENLFRIGLDINDIDYVFITHNHKDHVLSLCALLRNTKAHLYITEGLYDSLKEKPIKGKYTLFEDEIILDNIKFNALKSSHDAPDSRNYVIEYNNKKVSIITDTGYVKQKHFKSLYNSDIFLMESNHDIDLLQNGAYPHYLKQRILGDEGHLSNNQAGFYLSKIIGENTKKILLIHLSEENNNPDVALLTVKKILAEYNIDFENINYAKQYEVSEVMNFD